MRRPQFRLETMLWLMALVALLCVMAREYVNFVDTRTLNWVQSQRSMLGEKAPTWWWPWPR
jgi:hypothetical protein